MTTLATLTVYTTIVQIEDLVDEITTDTELGVTDIGVTRRGKYPSL